MKDKWKVIALVMTAIVLAESSFLIYSYNYGSELIKNEAMCSDNICDSGIYDGYTFDELTNICYCWEGEDIVIEKQL